MFDVCLFILKMYLLNYTCVIIAHSFILRVISDSIIIQEMCARKADGCTFQNCADENINRFVHFLAEHFGVLISTICDNLKVRK